MQQPTLGDDGWYPDPQTDGFERFWDGTAWTSQSRPRQARRGQVRVTARGSPVTGASSTWVSR